MRYCIFTYTHLPIVRSRLTNQSPFVEDPSQTDLRLKIATRQVDWKILREKTSNPLSKVEYYLDVIILADPFFLLVLDFIESLLAEDPKARMTLTGALDHPWLQDYVVKKKRDAAADRALGTILEPFETESSEITPRADEETKAGFGTFSRFENLAINDAGPSNSNDAGPSSAVVHNKPPGSPRDAIEETTPPPTSSQSRALQAQGSRMLRRRRDVLDEALEGGEVTVPQPSPDLVSQFEEKQRRAADAGANGVQMNQSETGQSTSNLEKQRGKRMFEDLSAVPEGEVANGSGGDVLMNGDLDDVGGVQPTPSKRRRTPVPQTSVKKGKKVDSEPVPGVRRSTRNKKT